MDKIEPVSTSLCDRMAQYLEEIEIAHIKMKGVIGIPQKLIGSSIQSAAYTNTEPMVKYIYDTALKSIDDAIITMSNKFMGIYLAREQKTLRGYRLPRKLKKQIKKTVPWQNEAERIKVPSRGF